MQHRDFSGAHVLLCVVSHLAGSERALGSSVARLRGRDDAAHALQGLSSVCSDSRKPDMVFRVSQFRVDLCPRKAKSSQICGKLEDRFVPAACVRFSLRKGVSCSVRVAGQEIACIQM